MVINVYIGSHVSFTKDKQLVGSLKEALSYGANTFMFYTGAPQNTNRCDIDNKLTQWTNARNQNTNYDYNTTGDLIGVKSNDTNNQ